MKLWPWTLPRRMRLQVSLKTLLVAMVGIAATAAWAGTWTRSYYQEQAALERLDTSPEQLPLAYSGVLIRRIRLGALI